ncbi:hypothetical protein [Bosea sp. (in: a-proteobacteria)]|uniref:hypothetical protein n=1 Tax=Bosea sp. (in: a-proteobacteria) TaxID=1871050 RepID=UPI003B3B94B2
MMLSRPISVALGALVVSGSLVAFGAHMMGAFASEPEFARPIELQAWPRLATRQDPEPVVDPRKIADAVRACVGASDSMPACATRRAELVRIFTAALEDPAALRATATCLSRGCDDLAPVAPANACLFWVLYSERHPTQFDASDKAAMDSSCASARFGDESRKAAIVRLWNRAAKG